MKKQDFCCVENFSVIVPYRELEKLLETSNKLEHIEVSIRHTEQMCASMRLMYSELLEKVAEINRYL